MDDVYVETAFGVLKALPDVIEIGKDIWKQLKPPKQMSAEESQDGINKNNYYSKDYHFSISKPDDQWDFWRPTNTYLAAMGPNYSLPTISVPIMLYSKPMIKVFRQNVVVMVDCVGGYTNIEELIQMSKNYSIQAGLTIDEKDVFIDNGHQSGVIILSMPRINDLIYQVQQCYLHEGLFYTISGSYIPVMDSSKKMPANLQEIMNSFKIISTDD